MDFEFSRQQKRFFKDLDELSRHSVPAESPEWQRAGDAQRLRGALLALARSPYLGLGLAPDPALEGTPVLLKAMEGVSGRSPSLFLGIEVSSRLFGRAVHTWGNAEQKKRWLAPLAHGERLAAMALPGGAEELQPDALAAEEGQGGYVLSGIQRNAVNAPEADWLALTGRVGGGLGIFVVERGAAGMHVGERLPSFSHEGALLSHVHLESCHVLARDLLGPLDPANALRNLRLWESQILVGASLGILKTSFTLARSHAKTEGHGAAPLISSQEVAFKLAEMLTLIETAQLLAYRAGSAADAGEPDAETLACCAKVFCTEAAEKVASDALSILGLGGLAADSSAVLAYHCAKFGQIAGLPVETARLRIGEAALSSF